MPLVTDATQYFAPYEEPANSWEELESLFLRVLDRHPDRQFAWRGQSDSRWSLSSSLYRRLWWTRSADGDTDPPSEENLAEAEGRVLQRAREWGLHSGSRGRLSGLELLATLQHYGIPTRLIDITFGPLYSVFFAVDPKHDGRDGRIFAVDVTDKLLTGTESVLNDPEADWSTLDRWNRTIHAWRPAGFDKRIAAQHGGFLLGGVPVTGENLPVWPKNPANANDRWLVNDVRAATSVATRIHKLVAPGPAGGPGRTVYTIRIAADAKPRIRQIITSLHDLRFSTVYPDFPGYAMHGVDWLLGRPPD